jgi:hypothetical protein
MSRTVYLIKKYNMISSNPSRCILSYNLSTFSYYHGAFYVLYHTSYPRSVYFFVHVIFSYPIHVLYLMISRFHIPVRVLHKTVSYLHINWIIITLIICSLSYLIMYRIIFCHLSPCTLPYRILSLYISPKIQTAHYRNVSWKFEIGQSWVILRNHKINYSIIKVQWPGK